jgi:hypothetical protein
VKKLQRRTETWDIRTWTVDQIKNQINDFFRRKEIAIEEIHVTPHTLEFRYFDKDDEKTMNKRVNPSKRF